MTDIREINEKCLDFILTHYPNTPVELRQTNRYNRLEEHHWFHGSHYVAISFWNAKDWRNKTANIYLQFGSDKSCILLMIDNDNGEKEQFFESISTALGTKKTTRKTYGNCWIKTYPTSDYLKVLDEFIKTEKPIIDSFIKVGKVEKLFPQTTLKDFQTALKRIEEYRHKRIDGQQAVIKEKEVTKGIHLKTLTLQNIGHYDTLSLDLSRQITCLIGENGSGKTTILRGLALGLTGIAPFNEEAHKPAIQRFLKIKNAQKEKIEYGTSGEIKVIYDLDGIENENIVRFKSAKYLSAHFIEDIENSDNSFNISGTEDNLLKYPIIGFSQQMHVSIEDKNNGFNGINAPNISDLRVLIFNEPDNRFDDIARWFHKAIDVETPLAERKQLRTIIEKLTAIINQLSQNDLKLLHISDKEARVISKDFPEGIPLSMLSQGYFNVLGWVGFFMKRLWEATPDAEKEQFFTTPAICLIDEIDTYLHPQWQAGLLDVLAKTFPNTQFIVTTHSPYIVTHLENVNDSVQVYHISKTEATPIQTSGRDISTTSLEFFGVQRRPMFYQKLIDNVFAEFDRYENGISNGSIDKLKRKIEQLEKLLGKNDPDVETAKSLFETLEIMES
jgi:predicted ATP-binding protein involved in virulence